MNIKRIGKWIIVLFLLAALPGMTAVMAQRQEPAKAEFAPAVVEVGESPTTIPYRNNETKNNNTMATAETISLIDWRNNSAVVGGVIESENDVDYWRLEPDFYNSAKRYRSPVLFNIDARAFGSPLDTVICLYADDGIELACNDDMQGATSRDSLLYYNLQEGRYYYLKVSGYDGYVWGPDYKYQLLVSEPLLISAAAAGLQGAKVDTIPFKAGDVLAWSDFKVNNTVYQKWVMLLDLSDLGTNINLSNLAAGWANSDYLLVGFAANATLPGLSRPVTPWEVVLFDPTQVGPNTAGSFQRLWDGRQHGLTTTSERIDALNWPDWNGSMALQVSTVGMASVPGATGVLKLADEDIGNWSSNSDKWARGFDGTSPGGDVDWGLGARDVVAYSHLADCVWVDVEYRTRDFAVIDNSGSIIYRYLDPDDNLVTKSANVNQISITNFEEYYWADDIVGEYGLEYRVGSAWGWSYKIDAIEYVGYSWCENG